MDPSIIVVEGDLALQEARRARLGAGGYLVSCLHSDAGTQDLDLGLALCRPSPETRAADQC